MQVIAFTIGGSLYGVVQRWTTDIAVRGTALVLVLSPD